MALTHIKIQQAKGKGLQARRQAGALSLHHLQGPKILALWVVYPAVTLAAARKRLEEARTQLDNGLDPSGIQRTKRVIQKQS